MLNGSATYVFISDNVMNIMATPYDALHRIIEDICSNNSIAYMSSLSICNWPNICVHCDAVIES